MPAPKGPKWEQWVEAQIAKLWQRSPFGNSGITLTGPGQFEVDGTMHVTGSVNIDGDLVLQGGTETSGNYVPGVSGFKLDGPAGNAEFNDVTLRGILVGLDTPVKQESLRDSGTGFGLTTAYVEKAGFDVTVPAGCTRVQAVLLGKLFAFNANNTGGGDGTGQDALYVRVAIGGSYSTATPTGISGSGGFATTNGDDAFTLTGLTPGGTLHVAVEGQSGYATIPADVDNYISVVASLTWLR